MANSVYMLKLKYFFFYLYSFAFLYYIWISVTIILDRSNLRKKILIWVHGFSPSWRILQVHGSGSLWQWLFTVWGPRSREQYREWAEIMCSQRPPSISLSPPLKVSQPPSPEPPAGGTMVIMRLWGPFQIQTNHWDINIQSVCNGQNWASEMLHRWPGSCTEHSRVGIWTKAYVLHHWRLQLSTYQENLGLSGGLLEDEGWVSQSTSILIQFY